jgi:hypothetical protein
VDVGLNRAVAIATDSIGRAMGRRSSWCVEHRPIGERFTGCAPGAARAGGRHRDERSRAWPLRWDTCREGRGLGEAGMPEAAENYGVDAARTENAWSH